MYMRIAIVGYGNLGQGAELALRDCHDCEAVGVFTRRDPAAIRTRTGIPVYPAADILSWEGKLDVLLLCGGSAADLPGSPRRWRHTLRSWTASTTTGTFPPTSPAQTRRRGQAGTLP